MAKRVLPRRQGFSAEERQCMGRAPLSSAFLLKAQSRRGLKEGAEEPPEDAPSRAGTSEQASGLQQTTTGLTKDPCPEGFRSMERQLAQMIQHILPLPTKTGSTRCSASLDSQRRVKVLSPPSSQGTWRGPDAERVRRPSEAKQLALLRKDRAWSPKEFPLRKNCIELVKGALATRIERALGGSFVFINEGSKKNRNALGRRKGCDGNPILDFRRKLLQKWPSVEEGFAEIDSYLSKVTRPLNLAEWSSTLANLGLASQANARVIYDLLDENKDGTLTLQEFRTGIEAVTPVFCLEALRKRLLCLGYPSMHVALSAMQPSSEDITMVPLTFQQFSECLRRVWVIQPQEHRAIFDLVRDPCDDSAKATLSELLCGLVAVSPPLLLEELRLQALRRYESVERALVALQAHCGLEHDDEEMPVEVLERALHKLFGFQSCETRKLAPLIDVDGVQGISLAELRGALSLAEPDLALEATRKKVQLRYRSIAGALAEVVKQSPDFASEASRFQEEELSLLLESVEGVGAREMKAVIAMVRRASGEHGLTLEGFLKGLRLFAPCCALEALRLQLAGREDRAFSEVENRRAPMDEAQFAAMLEKVDVRLPAEEISRVFHLLDIRNSSVVTLSELLALLQCSRPRGRPWREASELQRQAAQRVRKDFAPIRKGLKELKLGIRSAMAECQGAQPVFGGPRLAVSTSLPELRSEDSPLARKTFQRISSALGRVPDFDEQGTKIVEIREEIGGYFESHQRSLSSHEELLEQPILSQADGYNLACKLRRRAQLP